MKKLSLKKGFTLIELLVVVAIIGILASVVLASLNTARGKGADASIKANLSNMRAQAALFYDDNTQSFGASNTCQVAANGTTTPAACTGIWAQTPMISSLKQAASNASSTLYAATDSTGQLYAIKVQLKGVPGDYWCVDSAGKAVQTTGTAASGTSCP